jgi:uncharacterized RDD family membrane protein YckC
VESDMQDNVMEEIDNEAAEPQSQSGVISGFWRRTAAFTVDTLLIGLVGIIVGFSGFSFFSQLGFSGRLFGFGICLLYFGLGNSRFMNGQTVGKKILRIRVVDKEGGLISFGKSAVRFTVFGIPFFLNNAPLPPPLAFSTVASSVIFFIIAGLGGAIIYLYIFNRRTRQSLHDLAAGTYVVKADNSTQIDAKIIWKGHYALITTWMVLVLVFVIGLNLFASKSEFFSDLEYLHKQLYISTNAKQVEVFVGKNWTTNGTSTYFSAVVFLKGEPQDYEGEANNIADMIFKMYPEAEDKDIVVIKIVRGFDIGISKGWRSMSYSFGPGEWRERITDSAPEMLVSSNLD